MFRSVVLPCFNYNMSIVSMYTLFDSFAEVCWTAQG